MYNDDLSNCCTGGIIELDLSNWPTQQGGARIDLSPYNDRSIIQSAKSGSRIELPSVFLPQQESVWERNTILQSSKVNDLSTQFVATASKTYSIQTIIIPE